MRRWNGKERKEKEWGKRERDELDEEEKEGKEGQKYKKPGPLPPPHLLALLFLILCTGLLRCLVADSPTQKERASPWEKNGGSLT